jgi:uncharacterized phiE125 gp8 family phage protein
MKYSLQPVQDSPPTTLDEPVTWDDVKAALRITSNVELAYFEDILIPAAREYCERVQGSALVRRTWELTLDAFPSCGAVEIPLRPVVSVQSIAYYDTAGSLQTLASGAYSVDTASFRPRIALSNPGFTWPATQARIQAVSVLLRAGYLPEDVPRVARQAVMLLCGHWDAHREAVGTVQDREVEFAVTALLNTDRSIPI